MLPDLLARVVAGCARRAVPVLLAALLLGVACVALAVLRLGVTTDTSGLFAASLPWRKNQVVMQQAFPQGEDLLVAVVDAPIPEAADTTATALAALLARDTFHFKLVRRPDADPFLERNGLLFLEPDKLQALLDQTVDAQPFLGKLAADPSLRGLMGALDLIAEGVERGQADLAAFTPALRGFHDALAVAASGKPRPLSWQRLLAGPVADLAGRYRFVLAKPNLDYGSFEPGAEATDAMRAAIAQLPLVRSGEARVRITGSVALEDEEFSTVADGMVSGLVGSMVLVALWLWLAVKSWRLIVPILGTLILGLLYTTGFAALAVGTLNLISVAFAVLFVGIAVDFAIQFSVRLRGALLSHAAVADAMAMTGRRAGPQILVASLATALGFLAFTPTSFAGVAQLGLVAGGGMIIAFAATLTVLPAALALCRVGDARPGEEEGLPALRPLDAVLVRARRPVLAVFGVLGLAGLGLLPWLGFDGDPLHTKNPDTEAMRALQDLMDDPVTNPYSAEVLAPDLAAAVALAARLQALAPVGDVLTAQSLVPDDQAAKLPLVADAASLLTPTLDVDAAPAPDAAALRRAVQDAAAHLTAAARVLPAGSPLVLVAADLRALAQQNGAVLGQANTALTQYLPLQLGRLRTALRPVPSTVTDLPPDLARDWLLPDGRARVQANPKPGVSGSEGLHRFVAAVRTVAPDAAGSAVTITASADTIVAAFRAAAGYAFLAITAILALVLRRAGDVALVLAPLLLSSLLTVLACVLLPLPLNFANIIALPLLLGVGVSFNIYFVMNWRAGQDRPLGSATARAVLFSALTTGTAFGSLALSHHPGTASMGVLLLLSLGCTLVVTMVFLPALLAAVPRRESRGLRAE